MPRRASLSLANPSVPYVDDPYDALTLETEKIRVLAEVIEQLRPNDGQVCVLALMIVDQVAVINAKAEGLPGGPRSSARRPKAVA
jgi:hypothetical protein